MVHIYGTDFAFAAVTSGGSVVTWGDRGRGGDSQAVADQLTASADVPENFFLPAHQTWGSLLHKEEED